MITTENLLRAWQGVVNPCTERHKPIPGEFAAAIRAAEIRETSNPAQADD